MSGEYYRSIKERTLRTLVTDSLRSLRRLKVSGGGKVKVVLKHTEIVALVEEALGVRVKAYEWVNHLIPDGLSLEVKK